MWKLFILTVIMNVTFLTLSFAGLGQVDGGGGTPECWGYNVFQSEFINYDSDPVKILNPMNLFRNNFSKIAAGNGPVRTIHPLPGYSPPADYGIGRQAWASRYIWLLKPHCEAQHIEKNYIAVRKEDTLCPNVTISKPGSDISYAPGFSPYNISNGDCYELKPTDTGTRYTCSQTIVYTDDHSCYDTFNYFHKEKFEAFVRKGDEFTSPLFYIMYPN